jgi:hypothetical protein
MTQRARAFFSGLAVAVLFCLPLVPEILGARRLIFRDAQITHWPWTRIAAQSLAAGRVPFVNIAASGGEPLLANPNAVLLYPTVLLQKVFAPAAAFNLHYLLHVLWAFLGARALARRLGLGPGAAFFAAVAFAFSGIMMSYGSAFANSAAASSWLPWCAAAALDLVRAGRPAAVRRAGAATAIAFGLQALGGEPALSVLTLLFSAFLAAFEVFASREGRSIRARRLLAGGVPAGILAAALASPLLLPLAQVFPMTYRGQHIYSERAFGASPFSAWRAIEWFFPRFGGDPGALFAGAHWQYALHGGDIVYVWCVTLGVIPLLAVAVAVFDRGFWTRRTTWLAAGAAVSFFFALGPALPFWHLLASVAALRRLRYPIKFYLLTTLCVSLLAGFAAERLRPGEARGGRRARLVLLAAALLDLAALFASTEGGFVERVVAPMLSGLAAPASDLLPAIRGSLMGDALFGLLAAAVLMLVLFSRRPIRGQSYLLGLATLLLAFPWALPLFVSADEKDLARSPVLSGAMKGPGRAYVSARLPEFNVLVSGTAHPLLPPRVARLARAQIEELIPETAAPFGIRYVFDSDPDGSYGYYNRLAEEALAASGPLEQGRLLQAYGARWLLDEEGREHPLFPPVTGFEVAGRRLVLSETSSPIPEIRWAGRSYRRSSLSGALELVRSAGFDPWTDVVLPAREDGGPTSPASPARLSVEGLKSDEAACTVEAEGAGHVVLARTYFAAWKARLDGKETPVLVANARDLAVAVPPGRHRVEFLYDRRPFHRGVAAQAAAFLAILLAAVVTRD